MEEMELYLALKFIFEKVALLYTSARVHLRQRLSFCDVECNIVRFFVRGILSKGNESWRIVVSYHNDVKFETVFEIGLQLLNMQIGNWFCDLEFSLRHIIQDENLNMNVNNICLKCVISKRYCEESRGAISISIRLFNAFKN